MRMSPQVSPNTRRAYALFHEASLTLAQMEANGLRVDMDFVFRAEEELAKQKSAIVTDLLKDEIWKRWQKRYGHKANLGNNDQLGSIIFDDLGYKFKGEITEITKKRKFGASSFADVDLPFVQKYFKLEKIDKVLNTFLKGIKEETVDGFLHPSFNLNHITTYRSSSDSPNFHNFPTRDYEQAKQVRPAIRSREGRRLVCMDFKGIEVFIATCYHKDRTMIRYNKDPKSDMHRDMAMDCYMLKEKDVSKKTRYCAKNMLVFPQFYGSYYIDCAKNLWEAITQHKLALADGTSILRHLSQRGIQSLGACDPNVPPKPGTFESHVKEVERILWEERFPEYAAWKDKWYKDYRRRGYADYLTGFRVQGLFRRNEIINYPVQGAAFHCLLWCMNKLQKWITKNKMKSLLVGQIHDDLMGDVPEDEIQDYLGKAHELMTVDLRKEWDWIIVPISVEAEVTPLNGNWFQKKQWAPVNSVWQELKEAV